MAARLTSLLRSSLQLLLLTVLAGCCGPVRGLYPPDPADPVREIHVVNNHWHTGLVLRCSDLSPELGRMLARFADAQFIEIGWGDDGFYRAPKATSGLAMQAMFASRGSVLHVVALSRPPEEYYQHYIVDLYRLRISEQGYLRLMRFVEASIAQTDTGQAIELQPGLYEQSWFYRARGRYSAFHTCNHWLADGVRTTGFPITPFWAAAADNVGWQIRTFGRKYQADPLILRNGVPAWSAPRRIGTIDESGA